MIADLVADVILLATACAAVVTVRMFLRGWAGFTNAVAQAGPYDAPPTGRLLAAFFRLAVGGFGSYYLFVHHLLPAIAVHLNS